MKKNVLFLLLLGLLTTVSAQPTHRIKGTVIDKASRQPLEFINVLVLGLGRGGVTDAEGHFNIGEVPPGIYRLQASASKPYNESANDQTNWNYKDYKDTEWSRMSNRIIADFQTLWRDRNIIGII